MPKGYWVTTYRSIKDPNKLAAYAKLAPVALAPFGAKYIVRGAAVAASEAGIKQRVVISVFDSVAKAIAAHDSPAYQAAVKVLGDGAERDVQIVVKRASLAAVEAPCLVQCVPAEHRNMAIARADIPPVHAELVEILRLQKRREQN